ncbi:MAG: hypothetical protein Q4G26_07685 [Paracoccus sp. (in: a-proteobacteria)]|nr:hypothetical protein [Paracoccus sp. (in: a-proteobacteria)]
MSFRALPGLSLLLVLAACSDHATDYPRLMPTDRLLAEPAIPGHAGIAATSPDQVAADLAAAGAGLHQSSARITAEGSAGDAELARRAEALRRRAAALAASDLSSCPALPDGTLPETC